MSESLQPGLHPDPDTLGAFVEGMLPEHERLACMAHLAECPACREVAYLAEESLASDPAPVPVEPEKVSFWKRCLRPIPALTFATALGTLVLSFSLYEHLKSIPMTPPVVAIATPPPAPEPKLAPVPTNDVEITPRVQNRAAPITPKDVPAPPAPPIPTATDMPLTAPGASAPQQPVAPDGAAPLRASAAPMAASAKPVPTTGIAGTITDPAGGAVAGAEVKLRLLTGPAAKDLTSDPKGQFDVAGLEPGPYEMQVLAKGFKQMTRQIEVHPNQIARADSTLSVGSVSESVSVVAETAPVRTETNMRSASPTPMAGGRGGGGGGGRGAGSGGFAGGGRAVQAPAQSPALALDGIAAATPLPNKLPAPVTITKGKVMLTTDSAGSLLLSVNAGKKWKTVKPVWQGKVTGLVLLTASAASDPIFQLTTDAGTIWLSRDGSHWYAAPK